MKQLCYVTILLVLFNVSLSGQTDKLSLELQQTFKTHAKELVGRFGSHCKLIADKEISFFLKASNDYCIQVALHDFDGEEILRFMILNN